MDLIGCRSKWVKSIQVYKALVLLGVRVHNYNPSSWEAEAGELIAIKFELFWATLWVPS